MGGQDTDSATVTALFFDLRKAFTSVCHLSGACVLGVVGLL
eukprot:CAMPEP_0176329390 /NCGR_PEP_ID=MMETSP0121_2-20121125/75458_1 /TAXON_ID=160619 /ORGANISM="Kryptoperidinium foliaceum, Strain CCMP 1326" /LENGTH=40 /DNA_ID= /DNA_START= /DNA_END= /DNA_ORIENTATION=